MQEKNKLHSKKADKIKSLADYVNFVRFAGKKIRKTCEE
jgi:hypothetical protein